MQLRETKFGLTCWPICFSKEKYTSISKGIDILMTTYLSLPDL